MHRKDGIPWNIFWTRLLFEKNLFFYLTQLGITKTLTTFLRLALGFSIFHIVSENVETFEKFLLFEKLPTYLTTILFEIVEYFIRMVLFL